MAANEFASMLHRKTNKLAFVLIYAVLEWILIIFLLFNSLFSFLIVKFADYFGLKRPCLWCSRLEYTFEPQKINNFYTDLVCEFHASEISKLGYCSNHRKLAESSHMCEDCLPDCRKTADIALFRSLKETGMIQIDGRKRIANGDMCLKCSCCGLCLSSTSFTPCVLEKLASEVLNSVQKGFYIAEAEGVPVDGEEYHQNLSNYDMDRCDDGRVFEKRMEDGDAEGWVDNKKLYDVHEADDGFWEFEVNQYDKEGMIIQIDQPSHKISDLISFTADSSPDGAKKDSPADKVTEPVVGFTDYDRSVPIELFDSSDAVADNHTDPDFKEENGEKHKENQELSLSRNNFFKTQAETDEVGNCVDWSTKESVLVREMSVEVAISQAAETASNFVDNGQEAIPAGGEKDSDVHGGIADELMINAASDVGTQMWSNGIEEEISIAREIPDKDHTDETQIQDISRSHPSMDEDHGVSSANLHVDDDNGSNEMKEGKALDTLTCADTLHHLHNNLLLLGRRVSGMDESCDGSIISEYECDNGVQTIEKLKVALRAERKALNALYAELEEERSASAIATNQTMAMINRLQEEKAAMQMEALQYQRMMDEQSEYDQEALQLLNEVMVKREKEKQELEKELEVYRKVVMEYEAKERSMKKRIKKSCSRSGNFSASSSDATEDNDEISADLIEEMKKEEHGFHVNEENGHCSTPIDTVLNLEDSLTSFEDERLSILEELRVLEEKLFMLDTEEAQTADIKPIGRSYIENGNGRHFDENFEFVSQENGFENGSHGEENGGFHYNGSMRAPKAKKLLPLFDATDGENEMGVSNGHDNGYEYARLMFGNSSSQLNYKELAIEEEVGHLYERLQALEEDREFLQRCFGSLKKGDKGVHLLQEILQHLKDLKNVELRMRSISDAPLL